MNMWTCFAIIGASWAAAFGFWSYCRHFHNPYVTEYVDPIEEGWNRHENER